MNVHSAWGKADLTLHDAAVSNVTQTHFHLASPSFLSKGVLDVKANSACVLQAHNCECSNAWDAGRRACLSVSLRGSGGYDQRPVGRCAHRYVNSPCA